MTLSCKPFGQTADGQTVEQWTISEGNITAEVLTLGAVIRSLTVPDQNGRPTDIVLGFDTVADYEKQDCYIGAVVGRVANRIANGRFSLAGREYSLCCNSGAHHLHGGKKGFDRYVWQAEAQKDGLLLRRTSPNGEEGYPGTLSVSLRFSIKDNALRLDYTAESDADTLCSLTHHDYFNLAGHNTGEVGAQQLTIPAQFYTPLGENGVPDGQIHKTAGTPLSFTSAKPIGADWDDADEQIRRGAGFDHNFIPEGAGLRLFASAFSAQSGISMQVFSDLPGMQLYTGNFLSDALPLGKRGARYGRRHAFCVEPQFFPAASAYPHFAQPILRAGQCYRSRTIYQFN